MVTHVVLDVGVCATLEQELRDLDMALARRLMEWSIASLWDGQVQPTRARGQKKERERKTQRAHGGARGAVHKDSKGAATAESGLFGCGAHNGNGGGAAAESAHATRDRRAAVQARAKATTRLPAQGAAAAASRTLVWTSMTAP